MASVATPTPITPTPYRISTITFNGDLNVYIQGPVFFKYAQVVSAETESGFVWMECWFNGTQQTIGVFPKKKTAAVLAKEAKTAEALDTTVQTKPKYKSFDNQISMYHRFQPGYIPHIKLFKNGNIHITGLRTVEDGMYLLRVIHDEVQRIHRLDPMVLMNQDPEKLEITRPIVRLINSDFHIPFKVRRRELHQLLIHEPFGTICSFQPGTYPGVKLEYYWNPAHTVQDGCCRCESPCYIKKSSSCKKITVAIFESGSILITGATSVAQVDDAYRFICGVIMGHQDLLRKTAILAAK
jgi:Transcription factor TFIID (or TATA-binding protein, TBP)